MIPPCRLTASLPSRSHPHSESDLITKEEIACIISSLLSGKAAGHDHLCNKHLKFAPPVTASILTTIFNSILLSGHVPTSFEHGLIVPIPKGRNINSPAVQQKKESPSRCKKGLWHDGLFLKLLLFGVPFYIWSILCNWYSRSTSISRPFPIHQGVYQGAVLSPLCTIQNLCQRPSNAPLFIWTCLVSQSMDSFVEPSYLQMTCPQ